jgi:hypothetical protein
MAKEAVVQASSLKSFDPDSITKDQLSLYRDLSGNSMPGSEDRDIKFDVTQSDFLSQLPPSSESSKEKKEEMKAAEIKAAPTILKDSVGLLIEDKPCVQCILSGMVSPKMGMVYVDLSGKERTITEKDSAKALAAIKAETANSLGVYSEVELLSQPELLEKGVSFINPATGKVEKITKELTDPKMLVALDPELSKLSTVVTKAPSVYSILEKPETLKAGTVYRDPSGAVKMVYSDVVKKVESLAYLKKNFGDQPKFERSKDPALKDIPTVHELIEKPELIGLGQRYLLPNGEVKVIVGSGDLDKKKALEALSATYVKTLPTVDELLENKSLLKPGLRFQNSTFAGGSSVVPSEGFDPEQATAALKSLKESMNKVQAAPMPEQKTSKPVVMDVPVTQVALRSPTQPTSGYPFTADQLDSIMRKFTKGGQQAPLSGEFIMKLCREEGFDVSLFLAMAVHESNIGTNGSRSLSTKNMHNYGNNDHGGNSYQKSWEDGARLYVRKMKENYGASLEQATADNFYHKNKIGYYCETYQGITGAAGAKAYTQAIVKTASSFRQQLGMSSGRDNAVMV